MTRRQFKTAPRPRTRRRDKFRGQRLRPPPPLGHRAGHSSQVLRTAPPLRRRETSRAARIARQGRSGVPAKRPPGAGSEAIPPNRAPCSGNPINPAPRFMTHRQFCGPPTTPAPALWTAYHSVAEKHSRATTMARPAAAACQPSGHPAPVLRQSHQPGASFNDPAPVQDGAETQNPAPRHIRGQRLRPPRPRRTPSCHSAPVLTTAPTPAPRHITGSQDGAARPQRRSS